MVKLSHLASPVFFALVFFGGFFTPEAQAEVYALVDRDEVQLNESFTLVLVADSNEQGEPDVTGLDESFDILGRTQSSSISIVSGRRETSRRWTYSLLPKAVGSFEIPALSVGGVSSLPVKIEVTPPLVAPSGDPDVFIEVGIDREQSWVQAQVIYTLKLYQGVAIRQPQLEQLRVEGGEVLAERLGEDRRYEAVIDGRQYDVVERSFALFPQESGQYTIMPAVFRGSLYSRGRISSPQEYRSEALTLEVLPAVPPPPEYAGAVWLPAVDISVSAAMMPPDGVLDEGVPANIVIDTVAQGLQANQLPELELELDPALRVYPDQPDFASRALPSGMVARRQQGFAVIAGRGGVYDLPTLSLPWFDVDVGEWRVASANLGTLRAAGQVVSTPPSQPEEPEPVAEVSAPSQAAPVESAAGSAELAQLRGRIQRLKVIAFGLLGLWLATIYVMWRTPIKHRRQRKRERAEAEQQASYRSARKSRKVALQAAQRNDPTSARDALLIWAADAIGEEAGRGLTALARYLPDEDAAAVLALDRALYRDGAEGWRGDTLARVIQRLDRPGVALKRTDSSALPELFPTR